MKKTRLVFIELLLLAISSVLLISCTVKVKDYPVIKDPKYPQIVVKEREIVVERTKTPLAKPEGPPLAEKEEVSIGVFYPDPTRIIVKNLTYNIFIKVWLIPSFEKGRVKGPPDLDLPPNAKVEVTMPLGNHPVYAEGRIKTREYGWQSVGGVSKEVSIGSRVYYGSNYGDCVVFYQADFLR
jgi:hypothetical protein